MDKDLMDTGKSTPVIFVAYFIIMSAIFVFHKITGVRRNLLL